MRELAFMCPECGTEDSFIVTNSIDLPPDNRSDDISMQVLGCSSCKFECVAVYEESRRGLLDSSSFSHTGYRLPEGRLRLFKNLVNRCPDPSNRHCGCPGHQELGGNSDGCWQGLAGVNREDSFRISFKPKSRK